MRSSVAVQAGAHFVSQPPTPLVFGMFFAGDVLPELLSAECSNEILMNALQKQGFASVGFPSYRAAMSLRESTRSDCKSSWRKSHVPSARMAEARTIIYTKE